MGGARRRTDMFAPFPPRLVTGATDCHPAETNDFESAFRKTANFIRIFETFQDHFQLLSVHGERLHHRIVRPSRLRATANRFGPLLAPQETEMKNLLPKIVCLLVMTGIAYGGTEFSTRDSKIQEPAPSQDWYAKGEFNLQLSGGYAFTENDYPFDRYIHADHGWGGSIDAKYFVNRYLALGMEGYAFSATQTVHTITVFGPFTTFSTLRDERVVGAGLLTLTLRAPIGASRFAPFAFAGVGAIAGGGRHVEFEYLGASVPPGTNPYHTSFSDATTEAVGQFGGGLEMRLTRHFGVVTDFSWNVINGRDNNFGMARTGINLAF
jgi:hypothetical protein